MSIFVLIKWNFIFVLMDALNKIIVYFTCGVLIKGVKFFICVLMNSILKI